MDKPMNEAEALRAYFDAHMEMQATIDADKFGRAYVKANRARDRLIQLRQEQEMEREHYATQ